MLTIRSVLLVPVAILALTGSSWGRPPVRSGYDLDALREASAESGLRTDVLALALQARERVIASGVATRPILTVIDYTLSSRERRLWVLDLAHSRVLAHELVAHGRGSGDEFARSFSNRAGSFQSSLGTFMTGTVYRGLHGISLRLRGLDPGVNDRAEARAIVIHGAPYVDPTMIARLGRLGRSQGCPALSPAAASRVIRLIRDGTILFAYHPS
jgi:hypothetical protein